MFWNLSYSAIKTTSYKQIQNVTLDVLNTTNKLLDNEILDYNEKINLLIQDEELIHSLSSKELIPETLKVLKHKLFTLLGTKLDVINVSLVNEIICEFQLKIYRLCMIYLAFATGVSFAT